MSFADTLKGGFKNVGHYIATGAKYVAIGLEDVIKVANKAQKVEPEVLALVGALAGPQASGIADIAFHVLGDVAAAIQKLPADVTAVGGAQGVNLSLDTQLVNDIKQAVKVIEAVLAATGAKKPAA